MRGRFNMIKELIKNLLKEKEYKETEIGKELEKIRKSIR